MKWGIRRTPEQPLKETGGKFLTREDVRTAESDFSKWREGVETDARKKRIAS